MRIELSKEQYLKLVRLVMAGDWLINSHRAGDEILEEYKEVEQHVFSFFKRYDAQDIITYDEKYNQYYPTRELEEEVMEFSDEYDDDAFWDELISRLAANEAMKKYKNPTSEQIWKLHDKYAEEFETNGLDRMNINWKET